MRHSKSLIALALAACYGGQAAAESAAELLAEGNQLVRSGIYRTALLRYREAAAAGLDSGLLHYNLGVVHYELEDYTAAADEFEQLASKYEVTAAQVSALRQLAASARALTGGPGDRVVSVEATRQANAAKVACHFFLWLRKQVLEACAKLPATGLKYEDIPARVAVPSLSGTDVAQQPGSKLLREAMHRAGWPLHPDSPFVSEPESNAVGILSKVDRLAPDGDPWPVAHRLAGAARERLSSVVSEVVPVMGLMAETATTDAFTEADAHALAGLAGLDELDLEDALLSPQDLAAYDLVGDLVKNGVVSFKIEGRLKKADYVAATVQTYRKPIDSFTETGRVQPLDKRDRLDLEQTFSRGLRNGFLGGINQQTLVPGRSPKKRGVRIGTVLGPTRRGRHIRPVGRPQPPASPIELLWLTARLRPPMAIPASSWRRWAASPPTG